jgi:RNA polymerase sigma factor (sigma-70 family)
MRDDELIDRFVSSKSQDAFSQIVRRHMDAVYACARRQVRDPQLAEDVTQAVFIVLAKKAGSLRNRVSLAGWLVKTTHLAGRDAMKIESRRKRHEAAAAALNQSRMEQNMTPQSDNLLPQLDLALSRLSETERTAITLRYLEGNSTTETASMLGVSEPAAAKRITRALDHLRKFLLRKKAIAPAASLAVILDQIPRVPAPAALAHTVTAAATTAVATPAGLALANGVLHMMTWKKIFAAVWLFIGITGATGIGIGTVKLLADQTSPSPQPAAQDSASPAAANPSADLVGRLSNGVSIQVVGINENPSTGKQWWAVDGKPTPAPYARMHAKLWPQHRDICLEAAIKTNNLVSGSSEPASVIWYWVGANGSSSANLEGAIDPSIDAEAVLLPDLPTGGILRADVAAGPWKPVFTVPGTGQSSMGRTDMSILFSRAFTLDGQTHIVVALLDSRTPRPRETMRLVAIDRAGHQIPANAWSSVGGSAGLAAEYVVRLPASSIKQWQMQSRPLNQWIEIRNISLHRGQTTSVKITTSDDSK